MSLRTISIAAAASSLAATLLAAPVAHTTVRADGSTIEWSLDRQREAPKQGILFLSQGSGCLAASENPNLRRAAALLPDFAVVTVEKYGVHLHDAPKDPMGGCSPEFYAHHTVSQRVADVQRVVEQLEKAPWWDARLVLFGGSEGGAVVAELAPRVNPTAVVIFSNTPVRSFRRTFKLEVPPPVAASADAEFAKIKAEPLSSKQWGGNSYRWWADILDHDLTADVLATRAPILVVVGERDGPVEISREVRDDFQRAGHCNLTYWELPGYDHQMQDEAGVSHLDEVMRRISGWLVSELAKPKASDCDPAKRVKAR